MTDVGKLIELEVSLTLEATIDKLATAISRAGMQLFAKIDHGAAAKAVGLAMPPTVVLSFGNAAKGTPVMLAAPDAALDLPLRLLVREYPGEGRCRVTFRPMSALLPSDGVPQAMVEALERAQRVVLEDLPTDSKGLSRP